MNNQFLDIWLNLISDSSSALKSSMGTAIWIDGLNAMQALDIGSFFKSTDELTKEEARAILFLRSSLEESFDHRNFWVSGHSCLIIHSPFYRHINCQEVSSAISYRFVEQEIGEFTPWLNSIVLGNKFYSKIEGQIRIPFYTFNHENTHIRLFRKVYSNLNLNDEELCELIILSEWFCISTDLILAYDLMKNNLENTFRELRRVPFKQAEGDAHIFVKFGSRIADVNQISGQFRRTFLGLEQREDVLELISNETLENHVDYTKHNLLSKVREIPTAMSRQDALEMLTCLRSLSLTQLIQKFTGINYEAV